MPTFALEAPTSSPPALGPCHPSSPQPCFSAATQPSRVPIPRKMGLTAVAATLRLSRRGSLFSRSTRTSTSSPTSSSSLPGTSRFSRSSPPPPPSPAEAPIVAAIAYARRAPSPAAAAASTRTLLVSLASLSAPLTPQTSASLTEALTTSPHFLASLVSAITSQPRQCASHDPLAPSVIAARLAAHGSASIAAAIASSRPLLLSLAAPFQTASQTSSSTSFPPSALDSVADVLRACLVANPSKTASALTATTGVLDGLVAAAPASAAVAHLLARLVGTRTFAAPDRVAVVPCHKRGVVFVSSAQTALAAAALAPETSPGVAADYLAIMTELSSRALLLAKKFEDYDERADAHYIGHLDLISSAGYNDACRALNLLESPAPLLAVFDGAAAADAAAKDPRRTRTRAALDAVATLLVAARDARASAIPSVRTIAAASPTDALATALIERANLFVPLLSPAGAPDPTPVRLALAAFDAVAALLSVAEESVLEAALAPSIALHTKLVAVLQPAHGRLSVARSRIADVVVAALASSSPRANLWLSGSTLLDLLTSMEIGVDVHGEPDPVIERVVVAAADALEREGGPKTVADPEAVRAFFVARHGLVEAARKKAATNSRDGLLSSELPADNLSTDVENAGLFESVDDAMHAASEDYAQDVYLRSQLQSAQPSRDTRLVIPTTASAVTISRVAATSGKKLVHTVAL